MAGGRLGLIGIVTVLIMAFVTAFVLALMLISAPKPVSTVAYVPRPGVYEELSIYKVPGNAINYSRITIQVMNTVGKPIGNASITIYALTPYHVVPVGVFEGSSVTIPMSSPAIEYTITKWARWLLSSSYHSLSPGIFTSLFFTLFAFILGFSVTATL